MSLPAHAPKTGTVAVTMPVGGKRVYQFLFENEPLLRLEYPRRYGRTAIAQTKSGQQWTLRRTGFFRNKIAVESSVKAYDNIDIHFSWTYQLRLSFGHGELRLRRSGFWKNKYEWLDERDNPMMEFHSRTWSRKNRGAVRVVNAAHPHFLFLLSLGWFITVAYEDDSA